MPTGRFVWVRRTGGSWDEFLVLVQHTSSDDRPETYGYRWVLLVPPHFRVGVGTGASRQLPHGNPAVPHDRANWIWDSSRDMPWVPASADVLQALTEEASYVAAASPDLLNAQWASASLLGPTAGPIEALGMGAGAGAPAGSGDASEVRQPVPVCLSRASSQRAQQACWDRSTARRPRRPRFSKRCARSGATSSR